MQFKICNRVPSHWLVRSIEDVCRRVTSGGTPSRKIPEFFENGSWPWVKTQELNDCWIDDTEEHITDEAIEQSSAKVLPENTILLAMYGATVGQLGIARRAITCNQASCALIADESKAHFRYLYYLLLSERNQIKLLSTGAAQQNLSAAQIKQFRFPFPKVEEQRAIAYVLGTLDDKIELNRRMNETLEAMARAIFKSWFVDFDPVRAKASGEPPESICRRLGLTPEVLALFPDSLQDSVLGEIPEGWQTRQLSDICTIGRGASPRPINDFMDGEVPWVKIADATSAGGPFLFETKERIKVEGVRKSVTVAPGDLILSNSATCGVPIFVELDGCIHDGWLYFKDLRSITKLYLYHLLTGLTDHLVHLADGSVQKNLNTNLVGSQVVLVPPGHVVGVFEHQVNSVYSHIRQVTLESRTASELRDALLPKLLSNELSATGVLRSLVAAV